MRSSQRKESFHEVIKAGGRHEKCMNEYSFNESIEHLEMLDQIMTNITLAKLPRLVRKMRPFTDLVENEMEIAISEGLLLKENEKIGGNLCKLENEAACRSLGIYSKVTNFADLPSQANQQRILENFKNDFTRMAKLNGQAFLVALNCYEAAITTLYREAQRAAFVKRTSHQFGNQKETSQEETVSFVEHLERCR